MQNSSLIGFSYSSIAAVLTVLVIGHYFKRTQKCLATAVCVHLCPLAAAPGKQPSIARLSTPNYHLNKPNLAYTTKRCSLRKDAESSQWSYVILTLRSTVSVKLVYLFLFGNLYKSSLFILLDLLGWICFVAKMTKPGTQQKLHKVNF